MTTWIVAGLLAAAIAAAAPKSARAFTAYAKDYGFQQGDATAALQAAINSGASKVVVSNMGSPWIVRPLFLVSNQELVFEPGTVVEAKRGEFRGTNDSLFTASHKQNITIRADKAVFRMHKQDYIGGGYSYSQWRHVFYMMSCDRVTFLGGEMNNSGGDGIFIGSYENQPACTNFTVRNVICDGNYRQGISVTNAENVVIDGCILRNTSDQEPAAGIDLEPDGPSHRLVNILVSNCKMIDNMKSGIIVYPQMLNAQSAPLSITVRNCYVSSKYGWGIQVSPVWAANGVGGYIRFENCTVEDTRGPGLFTMGKAAYRAGIEFIRCTWRRTGKESYNGFPAVPICISGLFPEQTPEYGGIRFEQCLVEDDQNRPFFMAVAPPHSAGIANIKGTIAVVNPYGARVEWGVNPHDNALQIQSISGENPAYGAQPENPAAFPIGIGNPPVVGQPPVSAPPVVTLPNGVTVTAVPAPVPPRVYPNPAKARVYFQFQTNQPEAIHISLVNAAGETVHRQNATIEPGSPAVACDLPNIAPGIYSYLVRRPSATQRGRIAVAR